MIQVWEIEVCQTGPDDPPSARDRRWRDIVDIDDLIDEAFDDTPTPNPTVNLSPNATDPGRYTLPGIPTWYWIPQAEWQPATASYAQAGYTATATAVPNRLELAVAERTDTEWTVASCTGPGTEWHPGAGQYDTECWYQFTHASVYDDPGTWPGQLTIVWDGEWEITGPGIHLTGAIDDVKFTATTTEIRVGEIQSVIGPGH